MTRKTVSIGTLLTFALIALIGMGLLGEAQGALKRVRLDGSVAGTVSVVSFTISPKVDLNGDGKPEKFTNCRGDFEIRGRIAAFGIANISNQGQPQVKFTSPLTLGFPSVQFMDASGLTCDVTFGQ